VICWATPPGSREYLPESRMNMPSYTDMKTRSSMNAVNAV
jgi:hypothetical protein